MLAHSVDEIRARGNRRIGHRRDARLARRARGRRVRRRRRRPGVELPTCLVGVEKGGLTADALEARLRQLTPPIIARIERDHLVLDLRTVAPDDDRRLMELLART
jgi:hypothetical protein